MKIKYKINDCYITITAKCGFNEKFLLEDIRQIEQNTCKGLMRIKEVKKKKIIYSGMKAISLKEKMQKPITKYEFFLILEQFLLLVNYWEKTNIPVNNIMYNLQNVYYIETTKEIQFLYCPLLKNGSKTVPIDFVEGLIYSANPSQDNDMEYITRFAYFLKTLTSFNVKKIEGYIASEEPRVLSFFGIEEYDEKIKENNGIKQTKESLNSRIVDMDSTEESYSKESKKKESNIYYDENDDTQYDEDDDTQYDEDEDTLMDDDDETLMDDDDETEMIDKDKTKFSKFPFLIRVSTGENIKITKPVFRVGIKKEAVDYVILNNNTVSRSHADIICKNDKYYIYDLESKNKTYVNERVIPSKTEIEIKNSDRIKLSNEEFIFNA